MRLHEFYVPVTKSSTEILQLAEMSTHVVRASARFAGSSVMTNEARRKSMIQCTPDKRYHPECKMESDTNTTASNVSVHGKQFTALFFNRTHNIDPYNPVGSRHICALCAGLLSSGSLSNSDCLTEFQYVHRLYIRRRKHA